MLIVNISDVLYYGKQTFFTHLFDANVIVKLNANII